MYRSRREITFPLKIPFPSLLLSPFPIPATFSRFSFITGLGAEEQGGSAWPRWGSSSACQGTHLGFLLSLQAGVWEEKSSHQWLLLQ